MSSWGSFSFLFGPVMAVLALVVLVFVMRWAFSSGVSHVAAPARRGRPTEYGMLTPIAEPADEDQALAMQRILANAGYSATIVDTTQGLRVMAWPAQADAAAAVLDSRRS